MMDLEALTERDDPAYAPARINELRGVYPTRTALDNNGPRGLRGLADPPQARLTSEQGTSRSRSGALEELGKPRVTEGSLAGHAQGPAIYRSTLLCLRRGYTYLRPRERTNGGLR